MPEYQTPPPTPGCPAEHCPLGGELQKINERLQRIESALVGKMGNGKPLPGILNRVRALEGSRTVLLWLVSVVAVASIGIFLTMLLGE